MDENKCPACGQEVKTLHNVCPHCGKELKNETFESVSDEEPWNDSELLWGILGFIFPVIGLILFLIWKTERPIAAKGAGTGAIAGFIVISVATFFLFTIRIFAGQTV